MITQLRALRPLTFILAVLTMMASFTMDVRTAQAKCCQVNIENRTRCVIEAYLISTTSRRVIQINPGLNEYKLNCGDDFEVWFRDACATSLDEFKKYPNDGCFDVRLKPSCCINVCYRPLDQCGILITEGQCKHCP